MNRICLSLVWAAALCWGCAGGPKADTGGGPGVGTNHAGGTGGDGSGDTTASGMTGDAGPVGGDAMAAEQAPFTLVLKNTGDEDLYFNMDRGYGGFIAMYYGKPPNATVVLPFPKHCTASCDVAEEERCPECPEPEDLDKIKKAQKLEKVAPGESLEVPWNEQVHAYEKTRGVTDGHKRRCECYRTSEVPAETYTIRACGLRLTTTAKKSSKLQCITGEATFPSEESQRLELDFEQPKETHGRHRRRRHHR